MVRKSGDIGKERALYITLLGKVCPKEGTRVRVLGVYHNMAWYSAVGHRGGRGRGSGVVVGERRSGIW